jgi:hypothetical protein
MVTLALLIAIPFEGLRGPVPDVDWVPIVDTYRTLCIAPPQEVRAIFQAIRDLSAARTLQVSCLWR